MAGLKDSFCAVADDGHIEMYNQGRLSAESTVPLPIRPGDPIQADVGATLYRGGKVPGVIHVNAQEMTCSADLAKPAMFGMTSETAPFVQRTPSKVR